MRTRTRTDLQPPATLTSERTATPVDTTETRDEAAALLAAADDAIARALSRNSREFLAQSRQQGGQ
jgi:hypothetical protein